MDVGEQRLFTLEQLADRETARNGVVLFDGNVIGLRLPERTYDCKRYRSIDPRLIDHAQTELDAGLTFIAHERAYTLANVTHELQQGMDIMRDRARFWNQRLESAMRTGHVRDPPSQKAAIESYLFSAFRLVKRARHAIYQPREPAQYAAFARAVCRVEDHLRVKHFRNQREQGLLQRPSPYVDLRSDEQLVALALYLPLVEQKPATIVTTDCDIPRLLAAFHTVLTLPQSPFAERAATHFEAFPLEIYFPVSGNHTPYGIRTLSDMRAMVLNVPRLAQIP